MSHRDWITAAELALPSRAHLTGITRLQQLGLNAGPLRPLHFVVQGDLHLDLPEIFLHRTPTLPPLSEDGRVSPAAAYLAWCADANTIEAIRVGDWLLQGHHMTLVELAALAERDHWRTGAAEARWVRPYLREGARSLPESEIRAHLTFAGLPEPGINQPIHRDGRIVAEGDLTYPEWATVLEYEGSHHQTDRQQYLVDIDRYGIFRDLSLSYLQITKESKASPQTMVRQVHAHIAARGYDGPDPDFGPVWQRLFRPLRDLAVRDKLTRPA